MRHVPSVFTRAKVSSYSDSGAPNGPFPVDEAMDTEIDEERGELLPGKH